MRQSGTGPQYGDVTGGQLGPRPPAVPQRPGQDDGDDVDRPVLVASVARARVEPVVGDPQ